MTEATTEKHAPDSKLVVTRLLCESCISWSLPQSAWHAQRRGRSHESLLHRATTQGMKRGAHLRSLKLGGANFFPQDSAILVKHSSVLPIRPGCCSELFCQACLLQRPLTCAQQAAVGVSTLNITSHVYDVSVKHSIGCMSATV